jgi:hypothetical protein
LGAVFAAEVDLAVEFFTEDVDFVVDFCDAVEDLTGDFVVFDSATGSLLNTFAVAGVGDVVHAHDPSEPRA